jgi:hypothetical protein
MRDHVPVGNGTRKLRENWQFGSPPPEERDYSAAKIILGNVHCDGKCEGMIGAAGGYKPTEPQTGNSEWIAPRARL